jgi:hypothetical protein
MDRHAEVLAYYATPAPLTALGTHTAAARALPTALAELCAVVQGLIVHPFLAQLYGLDPATLRRDELELRAAEAMLDGALAIDPRPLSTPRPPERRLVGNYRHFSLLLCALLRAHGIPARARCGFGSYFRGRALGRPLGLRSVGLGARRLAADRRADRRHPASGDAHPIRSARRAA